MNRVEAQLTSIRQSKKNQIESYFQTVHRHVLTLSEALMFVEGSKELRKGYFALDRAPVTKAQREALRQYYETQTLPAVSRLMDLRSSADDYMPATAAPYHLQTGYIVRNPHPYEKRGLLDSTNEGTDYDRAHGRFHPSYRRIVDIFGYHDLMIVDPETLRVVYTVAKQVDLGTSLISGPYCKTHLSEVVTQCRDDSKHDSVYLVDFESYEPSRGAPAAFICSPIADRTGQLTGILVIQLKIDEIDRVISGGRGWVRDGLGRTGDSGIVGPDYLMRTTSRRFVEFRSGYIASLRARN